LTSHSEVQSLKEGWRSPEDARAGAASASKARRARAPARRVRVGMVVWVMEEGERRVGMRRRVGGSSVARSLGVRDAEG
jgi:hypothetical protein